MNLTVISPPPFEPVTLAEVYRHLRLTPDHAGSPDETSHPDDAMLRSQITAAREYVEVATRRALVQQVLRLSHGSFPYYCSGWWPTYRRYTAYDRILLRRPPLIRVERVVFSDGDNVDQVIDPVDYYVTDDQVPELRFGTGYSVPTYYDRPDALRVEYVAGYAPGGSPATTQEEYATNVPETLKNAVLLGVQLLYDNLAPADREAIERMRESMLQTYRIQHV
jgi:uncharacterized phiE125 gp8 family phage protein